MKQFGSVLFVLFLTLFLSANGNLSPRNEKKPLEDSDDDPDKSESPSLSSHTNIERQDITKETDPGGVEGTPTGDADASDHDTGRKEDYFEKDDDLEEEKDGKFDTGRKEDYFEKDDDLEEEKDGKFEISAKMEGEESNPDQESDGDNDDKGDGKDDDDDGNLEGEKKSVYLPEEEEPDYETYLEAMELIYSLNRKDQTRAYELLKVAADKGNTRALERIALANIFGAHLQRNFTRAYEMFDDLARKGHPIGQHGLAFMYTAGFGVNSSQAKALVNYVFAALGGHTFAQIVMGHKSQLGIGVGESCEAALAYYHKAAKVVIKKASLITGGNLVGKVRLLDEEDAVPNIYGVSDDEIVHYQSIFSESGNTGAQLMLGLYYMFGISGAQRSFKRALEFLQQASRDGLPTAHCLMGKIYTEGSDEVPKDYDKAYTHFKMAADQKHGDGYSGLGLLYLNGYSVKKDLRKARELFLKSAEKGSSDGQYYLGKMYFDGSGVQRDMAKAVQYFQLASHGGHLHAIFLLGDLHAEGAIVKRNCHFAVELLKTVSERGKYIQMFTEAHRLYSHGDMEAAFLMYLFLAELGFEVAQSNAAYILEQGDLTFIHEEEQMKRAMLYWNRAAGQGYTQARVKLGDYYYYGMGTKVSLESAAAQYRIASDKLSSPQAMFNLGYMYEHGEGVETDYHLAKRYYDMAAETSSEAIIPVSLALMKLNLVNNIQHYESWFVYWPGLSGHWDLYLISVLVGVVIILALWRTRH